MTESRAVSRGVAVGGLVVASLVATGCSAMVAPVTETIDGFALGPPRMVSGPEFHRLEVTARTVSASAWPARQAVSFYLYGAGTLPDGTIQREAEGPFRFLMVVGLVGGERHAMVLECDVQIFPEPDSCAPAGDGS